MRTILILLFLRGIRGFCKISKYGQGFKLFEKIAGKKRRNWTQKSWPYGWGELLYIFKQFQQTVSYNKQLLIATAASEPEANERGSSLISRRLPYRGLQTQGFVVMRKGLWLCASGMPQGIVVMREWEDLGRAACHEIWSASRRVT